MAERDLTLIRKTLEGDRNAFGDLVERYGRLVRGVIWETLRKPDEVEDLAQEVFFRAYEQLPKLRQPAKFASWLWQIATNTAIDHQRQGQRLAVSLAEQRAALSLYVRRPDEVVEERELTTLLWEALDRLDPDCRRIVVLYYFEGCGQREIARFLGLPLTTVKWRLFRARNWLRDDLLNKLGRDAQVQPRSRQRLRNKIMALLPVAMVFQPQPRRWLERWMPWKYWALGTAAGLGIGGVAYFQPWAASPPSLSREAQRAQAQARLAVDPLIEWTPLKPQAGQQVQITAADLPVKPGDYAELHYITDPWHPEDQVVPMRQEGHLWVTDLEVPKEAVAVFYYISPRREGAQNMHYQSFLTTQKHLRRYTQSFMIYGDTGLPVQEANHTQGMMAQAQDRRPEEILVCADRELALYPDHFSAYPLRWVIMRKASHQSPAVMAQIRKEQETLRAKYPNQPDLLKEMAYYFSDWQDTLYKDLYQNFSKYKWADGTAYRRTLDQEEGSDRLTALEDFLRHFPASPYMDQAYRTYLRELAPQAPVRAAQLADSLINRTLILSYDLARKQDPEFSKYPPTGSFFEGYAYSLRFDLLLKEGTPAGALALVQRLISSELRDPEPYLYLGRRLAGQQNWSLFKNPPIYPLDMSLAIQMLKAGLPWADTEHMLQLPHYHTTYYSEAEDARAQAEQRRRSLEWTYTFRQSFLQALAQYYMDIGDPAQAIPYLEEAAGLRAKITQHSMRDDLTFFLLGEGYERLGQWEDAERAYLQAVAQDYSHPAAEAALRRMHQERYGNLERLIPLLQACHPQAPEFTLKDTLGQEVRLSDYRGEVLLLYYDSFGHLESPSGPLTKPLEKLGESVTKERERVKALTGKFEAQNLKILHISRASELKHSPFRLVLDDDSVQDRYQIRNSAMILIDREGRLRLHQERYPSAPAEDQDLQLAQKIEELLGEHSGGLALAEGKK